MFVPKPSSSQHASKNGRIAAFLISLPERVLRSASALAGGLVQELSTVVIPKPLRKTHLYQSLVEGTLRFLIDYIGEVENQPLPGQIGETRIAENFLMRRAAGNGLDLLGILTFHASPVWIMAALADVSGAGKQLISEIAQSLATAGLLEPGQRFETAEQILDGLEKSAGRVAATFNMPPLNIGGLRKELNEISLRVKTIPAPNLPSADYLWRLWHELEAEAKKQGRPVFEISSLIALAAVRRLPSNIIWLGMAAGQAAQTTGKMFAGTLLEHFGSTLREIRGAGFFIYWQREFRPYLKAAAAQFSLEHKSLTERLLEGRRP